MDIHEYARALISSMLGRTLKRKPIKNTGFGIIYGMGIKLLAEMSECSVEEARAIKNSYLSIFPGLKDMYEDMKHRAKENLPLRTWGGREYHCEPSAYSKKYGRLMTFDYKMVNVLIQGSAADCTKQAIINYSRFIGRHVKMYLTVHDEILASAPRRIMARAMKDLKVAMEDVKFDPPMFSEGEWSATNWAELKDYDKKGVLCGDALKNG